MADVDETVAEVEAMQTARIAVYDDLLSAPRVVDVAPTDVASYIEQIAAKTYELSQAQGGTIPYTVIREVAENFIHAQFKEPTVSIMERGNTIRFADQGPGIADKERAQLPGFTSATSEMKDYIRGVGSGLPIAKEYLRFSNGRLTIEDNIKAGTVITITVSTDAPKGTPVIYRENAQPAAAAGMSVQATQQAAAPAGTAYAVNTATPSNTPQTSPAAAATPAATAPVPQLDDRDFDILQLAVEHGLIGPTEAVNNLGLAQATAYRIIKKLEDKGLLAKAEGTSKRIITDAGLGVLNG